MRKKQQQKKQLWECTIKGPHSSEWNCIRKWHLNRFRECSWECAIKPSGELFRVAIQLELLSDPKRPLRTRQQKDGKWKTKIMRRSQPYS